LGLCQHGETSCGLWENIFLNERRVQGGFEERRESRETDRKKGRANTPPKVSLSYKNKHGAWKTSQGPFRECGRKPTNETADRRRKGIISGNCPKDQGKTGGKSQGKRALPKLGEKHSGFTCLKGKSGLRPTTKRMTVLKQKRMDVRKKQSRFEVRRDEEKP